MRIAQLDLVAFGPFTAKQLSFEQPGLHIVYGPNEAGKSSALRALKYLLYGIPERTTDNFIHANDRLRIGGILQSGEGGRLGITRRKGRKNTLLGQDDEILEEQVLAPFLQGVTAELFDTVFGIDHQALVAGGQEILEQKGEVGQALFSAALGSHALHGVLAELELQADGLFRPRGSTQAINADIRRYAELGREVREYSLSSREWDEQRHAFTRTEQELEKIQAELAARRIEVNRLQRIQRVLPKLARRRGLSQELAALGEVMVLPADFAERRRKAVNVMESAVSTVGKAAPRLDGLRQQLAALSINERLLEQAETIENLHMRLGSHRKAMRDRPNLDAELNQLRTDAESLIRTIRPTLVLRDAEQLRGVLGQRSEIVDIGDQHGVLMTRVEQAAAALRETGKKRQAAERAREEVPESRNTDALRSAIAGARKCGDLDGAIQSARSEVAALQTSCSNALARLPRWRGELGDVVKLGLPDRESVQRYASEFEQLKSRMQRLEEKRSEAADALHDASVRLDEVVRVGEVPTEASLVTMRHQRDEIWHLLRRQWVQGLDVSAEAEAYHLEGTLPDAFEHRLTGADELSDRLRREADRVHALAGLQAKQQGAQAQIRQFGEQLELSAEAMHRLEAEWQQLWTPFGVIPGTPPEMRGWLDAFEKLRDQVEHLHLGEQRCRELQQLRTVHLQRLSEALTQLGDAGPDPVELEPLLQACEVVADRLDEAARQHESLTRELREREADVGVLAEEHRLASAAMAAWELQWHSLMQRLGLPGQTSPSRVHEYIDDVRSLFARLDEAEKLRIRLHAIDEEADAFREEVVPLVAAIAPELAELSPDDVVGRLNTLLAENLAKRTRRQQITEQIELAAQEVAEAQASIRTMTARIDALCAEAGCADYTELDEAERRSADHVRLKTAITSLEQEIEEAGGGVGIADLEAEVQGMDPDTLSGRLAALISRIDDEFEPKATELAHKKGREERELELMDGSDRASRVADQAQAVLATIRANAERYVQLKLAGRILRDQVERYRRENQGPLISRASEHFSTLTLGSFVGLSTDFNDKDQPVLVGTRPNGEKVLVDGMSSGTRDQLYLALRFASLERYMASAGSMPFIVDDILVDFDDGRSEAALRELSVLSRKGQVMLFTHHARVVEQASAMSTDGMLTIHDLQPA